MQFERQRYGDRAEHPQRRLASSAPAGAWSLAVTVPVTSTTLSSVSGRSSAGSATTG